MRYPLTLFDIAIMLAADYNENVPKFTPNCRCREWKALLRPKTAGHRRRGKADSALVETIF